MPLVSVLLPTYKRNASGLLLKSIDSVLAQDMSDLELLIVDDGSTDGSAETIRDIANRDPRVKHIRFEDNIGLPAYTTGVAFKQSSGRFIAWQFDDCEWKPHHLSTLLKLAEINPHAGVFYGQVSINHRVEGSPKIFGNPFNAKDLAESNIIPNCSTLIRREVYETVGWVDPHILLKRINDYDMWLRAAKKYQFAFIPEIIAIENGQSLPDSLGNSVSLASNLALKYMGDDRDAYLNIRNLEHWSPYAPLVWMNQSELDEFAFIAIEHFVRIGDFDLAAKTACKIKPDNFHDANPKLKSDVINWYIQALKLPLEKRILELDVYIQEQARYIDDQHKYIEEQHRTINEPGEEINRLSSYKTRFFRKVFQKLRNFG